MTSTYASSILRKTLCRDSQFNKQNHHPMKRRKCICTVSAFLLFLGLFAPQVAWGQFKYYYSGYSYNTPYLSTAISYTSSGGTIYMYANGNIGSDISISKNITIAVENTSDYGKFTLTRNGDYTITVNSGYTLTIKNIIIDGNNTAGTESLFWVKGTMNMTGQSKTDETIPDHNNCKIIKCLKTSTTLNNNGSAIHVYGDYGQLVCNGVSFENNENRDLHSSSATDTYGGGALAVSDNARFNLTNCVFKNNRAYESGGAIILRKSGDSSIKDCTFEGNTAYWTGGAIYSVTSNRLDVSGTTVFRNNKLNYWSSVGKKEGFGGAACFVAMRSTPGKYYIGEEEGSNIIIENNYARGGGGGIVLWCENINAHFHLQNFTMKDNYTDNNTDDNEGLGGALLVYGRPDGGHDDNHFVIRDGTISNNYTTHYGGGMYINTHDCNVKNVTVEGNYTTNTNSCGGAVAIVGAEGNYTHINQFINCNFYKNGINGSTTTTKYGGAIYSVDKTNIQLLGCTVGGSAINANKATLYGGGMYIGPDSFLKMDTRTTSTPATYNTMEVSYNEAVNGGGIYVANGSQGHTDIGSSSNSANKVQIHHNTATGSGSTGGMGGGIYLECGGHINDKFTLKNFELTDNKASGIGMGGGAYLKSAIVSGEVHNHTAMTISDGTVSGNTAVDGGGIYFDHHDADITNVTFDSHTVSGNGGAVFINGHSNDNGAPHEHDFTDCIFTTNSAMNGGALYISDNASANFFGTTHNAMKIEHNTADSFGGGVYISTNAIMGVKGVVTVKGNTSTRNSNTSYSNGSAGAWDDDVCLQTLSNSSNKGKIKVLGDLTNSNIGITELQVASGHHRDLDLSGNRMRQFTINYGDYGSDGGSKPFDKNVFFSNDTELPVILLPASSPTTTGKIELTLGKPVARGWYVAGIVDDNNATWGNDNNSGEYPDVPKRTLTGTKGVFAAGYDPDNDHIFVVRAISAEQEASVRMTNDKAIIRYPDNVSTSYFSVGSNTIPDATGSKEVVLHRYPGGHKLSNDNYDLTISNGGPMANTGPVFSMDGQYETKLYNIHMDGLSDYSKEEGITDAHIDEIDPEHTHNPSYLQINPNSALLSVEAGTASISLNENC